MPTLNPNLISKETAAVLNDAIDLMRSYAKRTLYPELILLALIRRKDTAAARLLTYFKDQRGLNLDELERKVRNAAQSRGDVDGDLQFVALNGDKVQLSRQTIIALDEALSIAQSVDQVYIEPDHLLAVLCESKMNTGGLLRGAGLTPQAITEVIGGRTRGSSTATVPNAPAPSGSGAVGDIVANAKRGSVRAVYFRDELLNTIKNMLSQRVNRHVILLGPDGVGKRSLVYSLGLLMAESKGPSGLTKLITVDEAALLDNPVQAVTAGLNQAKGGILFMPHIERFFGNRRARNFKKPRSVSKKRCSLTIR